MRKLRADQVKTIATTVDTSDGGVVVILEVPKGAPRVEVDWNLYRLRPDGTVAWQVSVPPGMYEGDPFVSLGWSGDKLRADRFFGAEFVVDPLSGFADEVGWHK